MSEGPDFRQGGQDHSLLPTGANKVLSLLTELVWKTFLPKGSHTHTHTYTQPTSLYPYTHSQSFMHTSNSPTLPHSDIQQTHTCAYSHTCTTYTHTQTWHPFSYMPMFSHTPICSPIHTHPNTWDTATHTPILSHTHTHTAHTCLYTCTHTCTHSQSHPYNTHPHNPTPKMQHIHPHMHTCSFTFRITSEATEVRREFFFIHERLQMQPPRVARIQTLWVSSEQW